MRRTRLFWGLGPCFGLYLLAVTLLKETEILISCTSCAYLLIIFGKLNNNCASGQKNKFVVCGLQWLRSIQSKGEMSLAHTVHGGTIDFSGVNSKSWCKCACKLRRFLSFFLFFFLLFSSSLSHSNLHLWFICSALTCQCLCAPFYQHQFQQHEALLVLCSNLIVDVIAICPSHTHLPTHVNHL